MRKTIITKEFEGHAITFDLHSADAMINATQMAKVTGKLTTGYLRLDETQKLIEAIIEEENERREFAFQGSIKPIKSDDRIDVQDAISHLENENRTNVQEGISPLENENQLVLITYDDVVKVAHGGRNNGTWMHRLLAIDFAGWLNPRFNVWMLRTIDEILFGKVLEKRRRAEKAAQRRRRIAQLKTRIAQLDEVQELQKLEKEDKMDVLLQVQEFNDFVDLFSQPENEEDPEELEVVTE